MTGLTIKANGPVALWGRSASCLILSPLGAAVTGLLNDGVSPEVVAGDLVAIGAVPLERALGALRSLSELLVSVGRGTSIAPIVGADADDEAAGLLVWRRPESLAGGVWAGVADGVEPPTTGAIERYGRRIEVYVIGPAEVVRREVPGWIHTAETSNESAGESRIVVVSDTAAKMWLVLGGPVVSTVPITGLADAVDMAATAVVSDEASGFAPVRIRRRGGRLVAAPLLDARTRSHFGASTGCIEAGVGLLAADGTVTRATDNLVRPVSVEIEVPPSVLLLSPPKQGSTTWYHRWSGEGAALGGTLAPKALSSRSLSNSFHETLGDVLATSGCAASVKVTPRRVDAARNLWLVDQTARHRLAPERWAEVVSRLGGPSWLGRLDVGVTSAEELHLGYADGMGSGIVKVYLTAPSAATLDVIHQSVGSTSLGSATPTVVAVKWRPGRPRGFDVVTYRSADAAAEPIDLTHDLGAAWWRWSAVLSGFAGSRSGARRLGGRVSSGRGLRVDAAERRSFDHPANGAGPAEAVSWCRWLGAEAGVSAGDLVKLDRFASTTRIARVIGGIERETPFITLYGAPQLDLAPL